MLRRSLGLALLILPVLVSCAGRESAVLRLATTTSTDDSGLLAAILPDFERRHNARVDVIAVGSGQAMALGQNGDADVLLVHSPGAEEAFVADGYGLARYPVMYNDFVVVGPPDDPVHILGFSTAAEALAKIAGDGAPFVSRGDDSGTHAKEKVLWEEAGIFPDPNAGWYFSIGQGMGETLQFANERLAYTLSDRGTYLSQRVKLPNLDILVGGSSIAENPDPDLRNRYSVIPVNPALHEGIRADLAQQFVDWLTSLEMQEEIAAFGTERYSQSLFYPDSQVWHSAHP